MVFRQRNSQRFEMDMSAAEVKRAAWHNRNLPPPPAEPNGSEILVRCLQAEGVKYLWGYPGGAVLYIYDALYKQDSIEHVLVRHEQAAVHAADGYARATGDVGVALVTSGPGVTNAITGIATAYMDSIPMVIVTGQVPTPPSAWTPSRNATPWASRARSSSTTSWSRTCATWR
jgi:acetolactate synthase-1/2/3 large subunit